MGSTHGQWDQQVIVDRTKRLEIPQALKHLENLPEHRQHLCGGDSIEQRSNLVVTGDLVHPEQRLRITQPFGLLHRPLEGQKRRALGEEHREGSQRSIFHAVAGILTGALVRQLRQAFT